MNDDQLRIRPRFILWLLVIFVLIPCIVSLLLPANGGKAAARIVMTRVLMTDVGASLNRYAASSDAVLVRGNGSLHPILFVTNSTPELRKYIDRTNSQGELLDAWRTPIQIHVSARTNVEIRSAGPNREFGDRDDIVFDSLKNGFVKP